MERLQLRNEETCERIGRSLEDLDREVSKLEATKAGGNRNRERVVRSLDGLDRRVSDQDEAQTSNSERLEESVAQGKM